MPVYMIRAGEDGPIKIGFSESVSNRLVKMQADCHEVLTVIRVLNGDKMIEDDLHRRFSKNHLRGEWFSFNPDMLGPVGVSDAVFDKKIPSKSMRPRPAHPMGIYLQESGVSVTRMAQLLGVSVSQVSRWASGKRTPNVAQCMAIKAITKGKVTPEDFVSVGEMT